MGHFVFAGYCRFPGQHHEYSYIVRQRRGASNLLQVGSESVLGAAAAARWQDRSSLRVLNLHTCIYVPLLASEKHKIPK